MNSFVRQYQSTMHGNYLWASVKYGILMAIGLSASLTLRYILGHPANAPVAYDETWVVFIALIVMSLVLVFHYRRHLREKKISFKEGFLLTFYSSLIACAIYAGFMYFYSVYIDKGIESFQDRTIDVMTRSLAECEGKEIKDIHLPEMPYLVLYGMILNMIMSILVSFLTGIICRNERSKPIN
ncbi:MAG: DUF4199 domain-containing protein [Bacteroidales bacterium]|nr:DUF4199 domain-containing protein [Bacteroidales bacterium]